MKRKHIIPLMILAVITAFIGMTNFRSGTWFLGWDALSPELNIGANIWKAVWGFWQENQGLGMLGGHGYSATLPHTFSIAALVALGVPVNQVRYVFTMLMLAAGACGMYALSSVFSPQDANDREIPASALFSSLLYMLGAGTQQIFALQLEAFIVHFAALPWLLFVVFRLLSAPSKMLWIVFAGLSFVSSVQGFIPPLFVVYVLILGIILLSWRVRHGQTANSGIAKIIGITAAANLYWLIPLAWFTATRNSEFLRSYNNLLSTPKFTDLSVRYGNLLDVILMRGFYLDTVDSTRGNVVTYGLSTLKTHLENPGVMAMGVGFFAAAITGIITSVRWRRSAMALGCIISFFILLAGLGTDIPGVSAFSAVLQKLPIAAQAFRSGFTKLILAYGMFMALFAGIGLRGIASRLHRTLGIPPVFVSALAVIIVLAYGFPALKGNMLYESLRVKLPASYTDLITYFDSQNTDARIAYLPTDCPEGWTTYSWGYRGSGFLHYGLKQPVLDRAFDVWSSANESFYREIMAALRAQSAHDVDTVLTKYGVTYVVWDPNIGHCTNSKGFSAIETMPESLVGLGTYENAKTFRAEGIAPLTVLKRKDMPKSFVRVWNGMAPNIGPYTPFAERDAAYRTWWPYRTDDNTPLDAYYPFLSVSSNQGVPAGFSIAESDGNIIVKMPLFNDLTGYVLNVPAISDAEQVLPFSVTASAFTPILPTVVLGSSEFALQGTVIPTDANKTKGFSPSVFELRGVRLPLMTGTARFLIPTTTDSTYRFSDASGKTGLSGKLTPKSVSGAVNKPMNLVAAAAPDSIAVKFPKINQERSFGTFTEPPVMRVCAPQDKPAQSSFTASGGSFTANVANGALCVDYRAPNQPDTTGVIIGIKGSTPAGRTPLLRVMSGDTGLTDLEVPLPSDEVSYFAVPSVYTSGSGRTLTLEERSWTRYSSQYILDSLSVWPAPLAFMRQLSFTKNGSVPRPLSTAECSVNHETPVSYTVTCPEYSTPRTIELDQAYAPEWQAYDISECGILGALCQNYPTAGIKLTHFRMNGWANGWALPQTGATTIRIVFYPQWMQWIGFAMIPLAVLAALTFRNSR